MKKLLAIWALGLILSNVLLFTIANTLTATFWISFAFIVIAYVAVLFLWLHTAKSAQSADEQFLKLPSLTVSLGYLSIQPPLAIVFALGTTAISYKIAILVHAAVLVVSWILMIGGTAGNRHIEKVNSRQKNHHKEL